MGNLNQALKGAKAYQGQKIADRNSQVAAYAPLVKRVALHIKTRLPPNVDVHDMIQAGMIGLMEAIQNFKSGQGATFETYAAIRIRGAIIDELRLSDWAPRSVHQNTRAIRAASLKLTHQLGRPATDSEIAAYLKIDINKYYQMMLDTNMAQVMGIEDTGIPDDLLADKPLSELICQAPEDKVFEHMHDEAFKKALAEAIANLPERERNIVSFYYDQELNLREIGLVIGISESRTCQILGQAVEHLKKMLSSWFLPDDQRGLENRRSKEELMAPGAKPAATNRRRRSSLLFDEDGEVSLDNRYSKAKPSDSPSEDKGFAVKHVKVQSNNDDTSEPASADVAPEKALVVSPKAETPKKRPGRKPKAQIATKNDETVLTIEDEEDDLDFPKAVNSEVVDNTVESQKVTKSTFEVKTTSSFTSLSQASTIAKLNSQISNDSEEGLLGLRRLSATSSSSQITRTQAEKANAAYAQTVKMGSGTSMFKVSAQDADIKTATAIAKQTVDFANEVAAANREILDAEIVDEQVEVVEEPKPRRRGRPPKNKPAE